MVERILVTSLDWVVDAEPNFLAQVKSVLAMLSSQEVAVVGFTERDREEIEPIRAALDWHAPFVTESGSAIFTPVHHSPFAEPLGEQDGDYFVEVLGCPYVQARAGLRVLANLISHPLKGYGDFTVPQLEKFLKVSEEVAHRAKAREFSEPFMTPKAVEADVLVKAATEMGFGVVLRDSAVDRFSALVGSGANVSEAIARIVSAYKQEKAVCVAVVGREHALQAVGVGDWAKVAVRSREEWLESLKKHGLQTDGTASA